MARILHVMKSLGIGGTEKTGILFTRYLDEYTDHDIHLLFSVHGGMERVGQISPGVNRYPFESERDLDRQIADIAPDIVHVYRAGQPEFPHPSPNYKFVETNVFGFYNPDSDIDRTLYMSEWLMNAVKRELPSDLWTNRLGFVNNPILPPATDRRGCLLHDDGIIWLGRCGRPDDGIYDDISVKAAWLLRSKGLDVRFLVMAPPPRMVEDLEKYDVPHRIVDASVDEDTLSYFYNSIDIYAHARADGETFGNNIAEAMYHSKPVVTHIAVPSHPGMGVFQSQTTLVTEKTGLVVDHSIPEYAHALECLIIDPERRKNMGEAAHERALSQFDWRLSGMKLCRIYDELLT